MKYFIRYTENAENDVERNCSYHFSDYKVGELDWLEDETELEFVAKQFNCDKDEIAIVNNCYAQELAGLCAFELESENLEDAVEESKIFKYNNVYNTESMPNYIILSGALISMNEEGVLIDAIEILYKSF